MGSTAQGWERIGERGGGVQGEGSTTQGVGGVGKRGAGRGAGSGVGGSGVGGLEFRVPGSGFQVWGLGHQLEENAGESPDVVGARRPLDALPQLWRVVGCRAQLVAGLRLRGWQCQGLGLMASGLGLHIGHMKLGFCPQLA